MFPERATRTCLGATVTGVGPSGSLVSTRRGEGVGSGVRGVVRGGVGSGVRGVVRGGDGVRGERCGQG